LFFGRRIRAERLKEGNIVGADDEEGGRAI
jgi:hypothetical protein